MRLVRPATRETMARPELDASNWRRADEAQWRTLWEHEIAELPSHRESRFWLAAGLLLPIWDRLPFENMRVRRLAADTGGNVGTCGGPRSCTRQAPLACYTCAAFRPWRDAPHEELLQSLVDEREALLADGVSPQVASANDATMMAIAEVADRCRRMREAASDG